jgi:hypothetical protein
MQKILVGLCTLFLLTVIFYKYSKDKQQDAMGTKKKWIKNTRCSDCKGRCNVRNFLSAATPIVSGSRVDDCYNECNDNCINSEILNKLKPLFDKLVGAYR